MLAILAGQAAMLVIMALAGNLGPLEMKPHLDPVVQALLIVTLGMLAFAFLSFLRKYLYSPSRLKLNVLIAIASLAVTIGFLLVNYSYTPVHSIPNANMSKEYTIDAGTIAFLLASYHFVLFGIDVLIAPTVEIRLNIAKVIIDIFLLVAYGLNFASYIAELQARILLQSWLNKIGDFLAYSLFGLCGIFLLSMASKSAVLQRKACDPRVRAGFRSWVITFFLIAIDIFLILIFIVLAESSSNAAELAIMFGSGVLMVTMACSHFMYKGFIVPASMRRS